ncbi:unnamed protein product [Dicrocoelium dendriticum]|nr:unnamed protein product [Dicrocoelium dendriticum]
MPLLLSFFPHLHTLKSDHIDRFPIRSISLSHPLDLYPLLISSSSLYPRFSSSTTSLIISYLPSRSPISLYHSPHLHPLHDPSFLSPRPHPQSILAHPPLLHIPSSLYPLLLFPLLLLRSTSAPLYLLSIMLHSLLSSGLSSRHA